jgi:dihydrolipoamide dehydrogenase
LPGIAAGSDRIWNYRQAMTATALPSSLLVVGSGAIGIEFASLFAEFGVAVSVAEMADRILPNEDTEVSAYAKAQFEKRGIRFLTEATVTSMEETATSVEAVIDTGTGTSRESFDCALIAVGVVANSDSLALEKVGVELKNTSIVINEWGQTCVPSIWAIGDVAGGPWLAHKASHEAVATVEHIAGHPAAHPINRANIPGCTYSFPQIASIGLTEQQALAANCKIRKGNFPFMGNGKALALGDADGFIKTVVDDDTGEILGAHMVGAEVTELIHSFVLARELEATEDEVGMTMFPHPTLSEALHESVLSAAGKALHI